MDRYGKKMISPELLAQVRRLHFHARTLINEGITGQYRSAFRGKGMEFEEVAKYFPGDDVRSIDWKVTARMSDPFIKVFREERELTVMLAVDVSHSTLTGSRGQLREQLLATVGALLSLIALRNNDKVGLVTYSDTLGTYHPPRKARGAGWRILHEVLASTEEQQCERPSGTDLSGLFRFLRNVLKRKAIVFVLSDFLDSGFEQALAVLARKHDVTAIVAQDPLDWELPNVGLLNVIDPENQEEVLLDTADPRVRKEYQTAGRQHAEWLRQVFQKYRVESIPLSTERPILQDLQKYFGRREKRLYR